MLTEIVAAANSLKLAGQMAVGLINLKTTTEVQAKAIELNQLILSAQGDLLAANLAQAALVEEVRELKGEITRMKDWEAQKQRYELAAPFAGCMVFALKRSMSNGQPPHYLCASCYQNGKASILQGREAGPAGRHSSYNCPVCQTVSFTRWSNIVAPKYLEEIGKCQGVDRDPAAPRGTRRLRGSAMQAVPEAVRANC